MSYALRTDRDGCYLAEYEHFAVELDDDELGLTDRQVLDHVRSEWSNHNRGKAACDDIQIVNRGQRTAVVRLYYTRSAPA